MNWSDKVNYLSFMLQGMVRCGWAWWRKVRLGQVGQGEAWCGVVRYGLIIL